MFKSEERMNNVNLHANRVRTIVERFNALLADASDLGPFEPSGALSIYRLKTEVVFELPGHVLTLEVPDLLLETPGQLDAYLVSTIAAALQKVYQPKAKVKRFFAMIADAMANVTRGKEASQANLVMKVIYDTLRSVQVWMKGD